MERLTPSGVALGWRLLGEVMLTVLWIESEAGTAGLALVLYLCIMSVARWRFRVPAWAVLADQAACIAAAPVWPWAAWAFALPMFDAVLAARPWLALPVVAALSLLRLWTFPLAAVLCVAAAGAASIALWERERSRLRREADADRRDKYELDRLKEDLLVAGAQTARMAELAERARIARDLHDHVGHELTAAGLALEAFGQLWREGDPQAAELLQQAQRRVAEGMGVLRATVGGLAPRRAMGVGVLEEICRGLAGAAVDFRVTGDTNAVPLSTWSVLEPCLKEALTNAARHGERGRVDVTLDVGPHIVRLCVRNATRGTTGDTGGLGLQSVRQRAQAVGGSISADASDGFRLVCVLPLEGPGMAAP